MNLLVTGGAGFIGSTYVRHVLDGRYPGTASARVTVLDSLTYAGNLANLPLGEERLTFVKGDVCDLGLLLEVLPGHDAVVHFAAESHVDRSLDRAADFVSTNVGGTQTVLEASLRTGVSRVLHVSTDEVYGSHPQGATSESCQLMPNSPYASSKAGSDLMARAYWKTHGLDVTLTRCSNNYGPYQHVEKVIPRFVTNLFEGRQVPLYGDGRNVRDWLHVDDHCQGIQLVLTGGRPGEIYNIGGGAELSNLQLTARILELCGAGWEMVAHVTDRKGHDLRYCVDDSKIRGELGYAPTTSFDTGLAQAIAWYRDNPSWWKPVKEALPDDHR
jgi:dTDP-glucose 4,6-dehydratase